jgi:hypothetical protein
VDRADSIGWGNRALALLLACVLGALWLRNGWPLLSHSVLPDSDDMVRLAQVRDWLGGQAFTDLTQHRLGIGGSGTLHWSRLGDVGVAVLILALRPLLGGLQAEIWAAILWPLILFAVFMVASARLAKTLGSPPETAILIAAFAFPAITMFVPGRIDHHGLQIVLAVLLTEAVIARRAAVAGLVTAAMLAIGLETAPIVFVALVVLGLDDLREPSRRPASFGATLGLATLGWLAIAKTQVWPTGWCDGFTPASTNATFVVAGYFVLLSVAPAKWRLAAAGLLAIPAAALAWSGSAICVTGPYGPVDPVLARLWLANVEEARGLFSGSFGQAVAFGGLALTGTVATLWQYWLTRERGWLILLGFQVMALAITLMQLRGSAMAAALAAPALAMVVAKARAKGSIGLILLSWLVSAGLVWSIAGRLLENRSTPAVAEGADCTAPETLDQIAALRPGLIISTIDAGAYLIGRTGHRVLAAPYHRNNRGNRTAYDFWLGKGEPAEAIVRQTGTTWVLACPNAFGGISLSPDSMAVRLEKGAPPVWLAPVPLKGSAARMYRVLLPAPVRR